ncbi:MAG: ABC transporter ATP-binding protein [Gemmatimonadaceae bacterium]
MIELDALTKSYRGAGGGGPAAVHVLKSVSCRIARGDFVAIMGASGSGKSTLLNILGFLERPDGGSYRLEGADLSLADDDVLSSVRNRKIGFVFQLFPLIDHVSALRNVMLPLLYNEDDVPDGSARALRMLESVGLAERAQHRPSELSGGEQQRVAIARALINDPALILADEPTGNLDAKSGGEILDVLQGLRTAGRTIVLVTHDRAVAERADRILLLEDGRLAAARTVVA